MDYEPICNQDIDEQSRSQYKSEIFEGRFGNVYRRGVLMASNHITCDETQ